jgi:hypothetical protein
VDWVQAGGADNRREHLNCRADFISEQRAPIGRQQQGGPRTFVSTRSDVQASNVSDTDAVKLFLCCEMLKVYHNVCPNLVLWPFREQSKALLAIPSPDLSRYAFPSSPPAHCHRLPTCLEDVLTIPQARSRRLGCFISDAWEACSEIDIAVRAWG